MSSIIPRPIFQLFLGISVLLSIGLYVQHGFHSRSKSFFMHAPNDPRLVLKNATIVGWDSGKRLWQFSGDELVVDHENHFLNYAGHGVGRLFFNGKPFVTIFAPRLRYDLISKDAEAFDGVRLYGNPATTLITDDLIWNQLSQRLIIPGKVNIKSPYGSFRGHNLVMLAYQGRVTMSDVQMDVQLHVAPNLGIP